MARPAAGPAGTRIVNRSRSVDATDREVLCAAANLFKDPNQLIAMSTFCSTRLLFIVTQQQPSSQRERERERQQTLCQRVCLMSPAALQFSPPPEQHLNSAFHPVQLDLIFKSAPAINRPATASARESSGKIGATRAGKTRSLIDDFCQIRWSEKSRESLMQPGNGAAVG